MVRYLVGEVVVRYCGVLSPHPAELLFVNLCLYIGILLHYGMLYSDHPMFVQRIIPSLSS